jgi:16S rRNA (guanine527-N7)-methyltransferase
MYLAEKVLLEKKLRDLGLKIELDPCWDLMVALAEAMEEKAEELHLRAVKGVRERLKGPFFDSLLLAAHLPARSPAVDLGSGAGIPGLVVKLARPELEVYLVEAYQPRVGFMKRFIREFGLRDVEAISCHIGREDCGILAPVAFARGYGEVNKFVKHAFHFFGAKEAFYLWRYQIESWKEGPLPLELVSRRAFPDRGIELLVWEELVS